MSNFQMFNTASSYINSMSSSRTDLHNHSSNKENELHSKLNKNERNVTMTKTKSTLQSLTKALLPSKKVSKNNQSRLSKTKSSISISELKDSRLSSKSIIKTPSTCKVVDTSPKLYLQKASKNLFKKVLNQTPKVVNSKMKSIVPVLTSTKSLKRKSIVKTKTIKVNLDHNEEGAFVYQIQEDPILAKCESETSNKYSKTAVGSPINSP